jgi:type II restriction/modification system DNA methylase subunit YeeA
MQLMSHAYSTISTKKRKSKGVTITAKYASEFREYNKFMRKTGLKEKSLEEYIAYRQGKCNPALRGTPLPKYEVSNHRELYPSGDGIGTTYARKENFYTGERKLLGIAIMHKSNLVPVFEQKDAEDIAKMRRG